MPVLPHKTAAKTAFFSYKYPYFGSIFRRYHAQKVLHELFFFALHAANKKPKKITNSYDEFVRFFVTQCNKLSIQNCNKFEREKPENTGFFISTLISKS